VLPNTDCQAFASTRTETICNRRFNRRLVFALTNTGTGNVSIQAATILVRDYAGSTVTTNGQLTTLNPLPAGRQNTAVFQNDYLECFQPITETITLVVRYTSPAGESCSDTSVYPILDARCNSGVVSEFCE
jgi:hypothetical protein